MAQSKISGSDIVQEDNKYTVKDIMRMLKHGLFDDIPVCSEDPVIRNRMKELKAVLHCEQILSDLERAQQIVLPPLPQKSCDILIVPSNSLSNLDAAKEVVYEEKQNLVSQDALKTFILRLRGKALPNSTMKKHPIPEPPPDPTLNELLQEKSVKAYYKIYGKPKPRPHYPILPPRERPPPPPEPVKKGKKKKKGKKGKKHKEPPPPINMTVWRKENLPVASARLWMPFFRALPCHQRTPNLSNPPTPPAGAPEPLSLFGYFIGTMGPEERSNRRAKMSGHYSPKHYEDSGSHQSIKVDSFFQPMAAFPPDYQVILEQEKSLHLTANVIRPHYLNESNFFQKFDVDMERKQTCHRMPITRRTIEILASNNYVIPS